MALSLSTTNESSFALCMMDAMVCYLDGVKEIGESRRVLFVSAKRRLVDAMKYTDMAEERQMALAMLDKINDFEKVGLHV